jgi:hypothetical protein
MKTSINGYHELIPCVGSYAQFYLASVIPPSESSQCSQGHARKGGTYRACAILRSLSGPCAIGDCARQASPYKKARTGR